MTNYHELRLRKVRALLPPGEALYLNRCADVFYLTGFTGEDSSVILTHQETYFITDGRYTEQARREARIPVAIEDVRGGRKQEKILEDILSGHGVKTLRLDRKIVTLDWAESVLGQYRDSLRLEQDDTVRNLRACKDELEVETIRQNLMITELGYHYVVRMIREGMTELEIAAELEYYLKKKGASRMAFETIVASGDRSSLPHGAAAEKKVRKNEIVMFDFGIVKNGYCSDFTRCYNFGKITSPKIREIHGVVQDALFQAQSVIRPGIRACAVHQAAADVIREAGYEFQFLHSTGHGVGIEIHELPSVSPAGDAELQDGMVFTVEPGIYLPGEGGIRLENLVVVRKDGCEILTGAGTEL